MITRASLLIMFIVATACFSVIKLPPQFVLNSTLEENDVRYGSISGSLFDLRIENASVVGFPIRWLELKTSVMSVLIGAPAFEGRFALSQGSGTLDAVVKDNVVKFKQLQVVHEVSANTAFSVLSGALSLRSSNAVISLETGCRSGVFQLQSNLLDPVLSSFGLSPSPLSGTATCRDNGLLFVELAADTEALGVMVSGRVATRQSWARPDVRLTFFLTPKSDAGFSAPLISRLESAGLERSGRGFSGNLVLSAP